MGAAPAAGRWSRRWVPPRPDPQCRDAAPTFKALDAAAFEAALAQWAQGQVGDGWETVALDGALRGIHGEELGCGWWPPTAIGPGWCWPAGVRTAEHEAELTVAPAVLEAFRLERRLVTGDALYCQRALCRTLVARGGAYFFAVKANQPSLHDDLFRLFAWPVPASASPEAVEHRQHGDRIETRRLGFRGAGGLCRLAWAAPGLQDRAPSRLPRQDERGDGLRGHQPGAWRWHPPNSWRLAGPLGDRERLHYVRDVTFGEDASQVRSGAAPRSWPPCGTSCSGCSARATPTSRLHSSSSPGSLALPSVCSASTRHHNEKTLGTRAMGPEVFPRLAEEPHTTQLGIVTKA